MAYCITHVGSRSANILDVADYLCYPNEPTCKEGKPFANKDVLETQDHNKNANVKEPIKSKKGLLLFFTCLIDVKIGQGLLVNDYATKEHKGDYEEPE